MTPDLLALDLSSTTIGWCASHGGALSWGEATFKGTLDQRLGAFLLWLQPRMPAEVLVIEQPFVEHRPAVAALYGVAGIARGLAASMEVKCVLLSPSDAKKHATGNGHATKEMMRQCMAIEPYPGEHAVDSIALMSCWMEGDFAASKAPRARRRREVLRKGRKG